MELDISNRLRQLRDSRGWTVSEMSYRTGIPKRTLDKYMAREGASMPGLEALALLSKGLGVSLDWLVFGIGGPSGASTELLVNRSATTASLAVFEAVMRHLSKGYPGIFKDEELLGLSLDGWAAEVGERAMDEARGLLERGVTREDLELWKQSRTERLIELSQDKAARIMSS